MKLGLALLMTLFSVALVQDAAAQWYPYGGRPVRSVDRWLGIGYSAGYHTHNPGPDSDYYQPYSEMNTQMQSWLPADTELQPTPAELPADDSPAPKYSPHDSRFPGAPSQVRSNRKSQRSSQSSSNGAFGWSSGPSRTQQSALGRGNSGFPASGQRVGQAPDRNSWR